MERLFDATLFARQSCEAEFQPCSLSLMPSSDEWGAAGLFAGVGGIELGLQRAGMHSELLCEYWVLRSRYWSTGSKVSRWSGTFASFELPPVRLSRPGSLVPTCLKPDSRGVSGAKRAWLKSSVCSNVAASPGSCSRMSGAVPRRWCGDELPRLEARGARLSVGVSPRRLSVHRRAPAPPTCHPRCHTRE